MTELNMPVPNGQQENPTLDKYNGLLDVQPSTLTTSRARINGKSMCVATFRTPSTTLTLFLAKSEVAAWARQLTSESEKMSGSGLITGETIG